MPIKFIDLDGLEPAEGPIEARDGILSQPIITPISAFEVNDSRKGFNHFTLFLQYEGRASAVVTKSFALGIAADTQGNFGLFKTNNLGGGLTLGLNSAFSGGLSTADHILDLEGYGFNGGGYLTAGIFAGVNFSAESNYAFRPEESNGDGWDAMDFGGTLGIPVQFGAFGLGGGAYLEGSNTEFLGVGSLQKVLDDFAAQVKESFDFELSTEQLQSLESFILDNSASPNQNESTNECINDCEDGG